ncbi:hypothetical protein [Hymenobacter sp. UYCo722]|uniref:hypothetical protein n=1 Tax=Hymenobacter sp. UYCo722 TaxID=3156335 RepID=UPI003390C708
MKIILTIFTSLLFSCGNSTKPNKTPTITLQQVQCLNNDKEYVKHAIETYKQVFFRKEEDIYLFKTTDDTVVGYLFEQGECTAVLTQIPSNGMADAEKFIAAEVKKNHGPMFITKDNVQFKYYTAKQGADYYLVASDFN